MRLGARRYSRRLRTETGVSPFRIEATQQGRTPRTECRSVTHQPAPTDVARRLGTHVDAGEVVQRENWYYADDEPMQSAVTYIPQRVAGISLLGTEKILGQGGIYARLEELGYPIARIREEVTARLPTPREAAALHMPPGVPVLEVLHTSYDNTHQAFEVTRFILRSDLTGLDYEMPVED
jgi:GntR family transcriptional regulator